MTEAALGAEWQALLAEHQALEAEHERLRHRTNDSMGHRRHRERLKVHIARVRAYRDAVRLLSRSDTQAEGH
jgi:hypothetical protein